MTHASTLLPLDLLFLSELVKSPTCFLLTFLEPRVLLAEGSTDLLIDLG